MIASNHVVTGSVFAGAAAGTVSAWAILPAAFILHFILDALPHWGEPDETKWAADLSRLKWFLPLDATIGGLILITIAVMQPEYWALMIAAGIACASPDLFSIARYARFLNHGQTHYSANWFNQFHHRIQWGERKWGVWIEITWLICFSFALSKYL